MRKFEKIFCVIAAATICTTCANLFSACESKSSGEYSAKEVIRDTKETNGEKISRSSENDADENKNDTVGSETNGAIENSSSATYYAEFYADGSLVSKLPLLNGQLAEEPNVPEKRGYTGKWREYVLSANENVKIEAVYSLINYTIDYHPGRGNNAKENPTTYTVETPDFALAEPTLRGFEFCGWYKDEHYSQEIETIKQNSTGNLELYAKWRLEEYSIVYETNGGDNSENNPSSYNVQSETFTLLPAEKQGYEFIGWFENGRKISEIATGSSIGNLYLTANWRKEEAFVCGVTGGELKENAVYFVFGTEDTCLPVAKRLAYSADCYGKIFRAVDIDCLEDNGGPIVGQNAEEIEVLYADELVDGENVFYLIVQKEGSETARTYALYVYKSYYVTVTYYYGANCLGRKQVLANESFVPYCDTEDYAEEIRGWKYLDGKNKGVEIAVGKEIAISEDTSLCAVP